MPMRVPHPQPHAGWRDLNRRMFQATLAGVLLLLLVAGFVLFLEHLWVHPFEWLWAALVFGLTLYLLVAQWRLASFACPRCGAYWMAGHWSLANPFALHRGHCHHCGLQRGEDPKE